MRRQRWRPISDKAAASPPSTRWHLRSASPKRGPSGRVAVVGDAAAAMAPNIGQGGGSAAVNALALAVCVAEARTVEEGLAEWERRQRPITEYTQRVSYWYGRMNDLPPLIRA